MYWDSSEKTELTSLAQRARPMRLGGIGKRSRAGFGGLAGAKLSIKIWRFLRSPRLVFFQMRSFIARLNYYN